MTPPWELVELLGDRHPIDRFRCGFTPADEWFRGTARNNAHLVATYVCLDETGEVVAFFALRPVHVAVDALSSKWKGGSIQGRSSGILICWMGLKEELRGSGTGRLLVAEAMRKALEAHAVAPLQLLVVDAANEDLVKYYEQFGFSRVPGELRLLARMSGVAKALGKEIGQ